MQVYAIKMFNFLRFGEQNNTIVFDLTSEQKRDLIDEKISMDQIYQDFESNPYQKIKESKERGIESILGIVGIIDGNPKRSNGAGKSTLMEAMCYAHYGKIVRLSANSDKTGEAGQAVVTKINNKIPDKVDEFWVEEFFESNDKIYRIKRGRKFSRTKKTSQPILEFEEIKENYVKGDSESSESEVGHRKKDTQKSIDDANDMVYELFVSSQMFGQNDAGKFLTGTDKTKKDMLITMLQMDTIVSKCLKATREKKSSTDKLLFASSERISVLEKQAFEMYKKLCPDTQHESYEASLVKDFSLVSDEKIEDLKIENYSLRSDLEPIQKEINELNNSQSLALVESIKKDGMRVKKEYEHKQKTVKDQVAVWESLVEQNDKERDKSEKQKEKFESEKKSCQEKVDSESKTVASFDQEKVSKALEKAKKAKSVKPQYGFVLHMKNKHKGTLVRHETNISYTIKSIKETIQKYASQKSKADMNGKVRCIECDSMVDISHFDEKINENKKKLESLEPTYTRVKELLTKCQSKIDDIEDKLSKIDIFISNESASQLSLERFENSKRSVEENKAKIARIDEEVKNLTEAIRQCDLKKLEYSNKISSIELSHKNEIKELEEELTDLRGKMRSAKEDALRVTEKIQVLENKKKDLEKKISDNNERIGFAKKELESFKNTILSLSEEEDHRSVLSEEMYCYGILEDIWGLDGMQTRIVKKYLPLLNASVKEFMDILSDKSLSLEMIINEKSEVEVIITGGTSSSYEMLSGGEKMVVRLAVDIGLAILAFARSSKSPEIICLDEIFGSLDDFNTNSVFRMLQHLQDKFNRILLITHNSKIKNIIPNNIVIEKNGGVNAMSEIKRIE